MDTQHNHIHKRIHDSEQNKFVFGPDKPLKKQINKLNKQILKNKWDGSLSFNGFKGTFKLEYWMFIEPYLRNLKLKKIKFIDTQLDKKYLDILFNLLLYLQPDSYQIKFKQNELDDLDLQDFTTNVIKFTNLEQFSIISNPGIFKGSYIDSLKFNDMEIIINEGYKSLGMAKKISQKLRDSLCQTYFYELGFDGTFTKENCQAFSYLIQQCYHEDHLEQLQKLSVNDCYLGTSSSFQQDCQDLVTQKGLLEIRLKNQRKIWNENIVQDLAGDRYDTMRVNVFDLSDNQKMTEKAFKIFASKVISSCKLVNLNDSLQQDPTVLAKLTSLIESFNQANEIFLEELDLSKLENYNRKDLSYKLLKATIFNDRSKVKLLKMANCDNKRMESYIEAVDYFKGSKQLDIVLSKQQYYLSDELQLKCLEKVLFTPLEDKYQVKSVLFDQCLTILSRQRGFKEFIRQYGQSKIRFATQSVKFNNTGYVLEQVDFDFFLKTDHFELTEFSIIDQDIDQNFGSFVNQCLEEKWIISLQRLTLRSSNRVEQFNINKFMKVFLLNPQSKLEYLQLSNFNLFDDPNEKISYLSEELQQTDFKLKLKTLFIDDCNPPFKLFKYGLFTPYSSVENLSLHTIDISFLQQFQHARISNLKYISLKEITQADQIWRIFTNIFLVESQINHIELIEIEINQGFMNSFLKNTKETKLELTQLSFQQCIFYGDFLSRFLTFQLQSLNIIKCSNFDICIEQLQKSEQLKDFNCQFQNVTISDSKLKLLSWFLEHIIFDVRFQLVEELTLNNMNLESQQLVELGNLIENLKKYENQQNLKRFYRLRTLNLSNNPNLSPYAMKYLFDRMLNCSVIIKKEQQENVESKETIQLIQQEQLNLKQKILNNKFRIDPLQIQNLNLALDANESQLSKSQTYFTIIQSLIMAPKSQLETLTLSDVDFNLFVEQSSVAYDFANEYCIKYDSTPFILGLKKIKFDKIQNESAEMSLKFLNLYIADSLLESLDIMNSSHILGQLLNLKLENSNLIEFYHRNGSEILDQVQTISFINDILLSKRFKIATLLISRDVGISFIDINQIDNKSPQYHLQNLDIELFTDAKNNIFRQLSIPLFSGNYVKLKQLSITSNYDPNLFIFEECKSQLERLSINYLINFDQTYYDFILTNRATLKYLKFQHIGINHIQLNKSKNITKYPPCELVIQELRKPNSQILFEDFIFSNTFQFDSIQEFYYQPLTQLNLKSDYGHVQILKFNFNLLENCTIYMDDAAYKLLGDYFIYNTASKVQEILFDRCNLSLSNCLFLTKSADNVNQLLSLKKFQIYYSFDTGPQGLKYIAEKIWFHPFIKITDIRAEMISLAQEGLEVIINAAKKWIQKHSKFDIEIFDIGRNEDCNIPELWKILCDTFFFTDQCPKLKTLYIHFMSLSDPVIKQICLSAQRYLDSKSSRFVHPLRILNLEYNNNITQKGWSKLFSEVIFHKKIHLEELIISDTDIEYEFVKDALPKRKTHLHTIFVEDEQLKEALLPYMSVRPLQYVNSYDSVDLRQNQDLHNIYKKILSQRYQKIEYFYQESNDIRISPYRLNFQEHFLCLVQQKDVYFSMSTLETLTKQFNYSHCRMDPYPLGILLDQDSFSFFRKSESKIQNIFILPSQLPIQDPIEQPYIVYLWEQIRGQNSINQIQIDYLLNDDLIDIMLEKGYTEREIIELIIIIPPFKIRLQDSLTLQAIKAIYSIFWDTNNFQYANMTYDGNNFLNMGIGYTLRETAYMWRATNPFSKLIKLILYKFCGLFVVDALPYRFDNEVTQLNSYLKTQSISFFLMYFMNIIYYVVCVGGPIYFTLTYDQDNNFDQLCFDGITDYADFLYYAFALLTFIVESYYYYQISKYTPSFLQKIIEIQIEDEDADAENQERVLNKKKVLSVAQKLQQGLNDAASSNMGKLAALLLAIILSQLAKFAFFNNVKFILQCYYCKYDELYIISAIICGIHVLQSFMNLIILLFERLTSAGSVKQLSTKFLNEFFLVSWIGRNLAIAQLLDRIAPYNVTVISNNIITRLFLPNQAGKSINNSVKNYLTQFIIQDTPQIIIQIFFVISQSERAGTQGWNIYLTVATSAISLLVSFRAFMSIRPSIIQQTDFDELAIIKSNKRKNYIQKCLEVEKQTILDYTYVSQPQQRVDEQENLI